jgi:molybdopterin-biosynthesis enzyme MoeA-like protein
VAAAFGVGIDYHPDAIALLSARYKPGEFNDMRKRMARIPDTATLVKNSVSTAPGFQIGNVFVMAGVPMIMRAMMEEIAPRLQRGAPVHSVTVQTRLPEGRIAAGLKAIQDDFPDVALGSYPYYREDGSGVQLVSRGRDPARVEASAAAIEAMIRAEGAAASRV